VTGVASGMAMLTSNRNASQASADPSAPRASGYRELSREQKINEPKPD